MLLKSAPAITALGGTNEIFARLGTQLLMFSDWMVNGEATPLSLSLLIKYSPIKLPDWLLLLLLLFSLPLKLHTYIHTTHTYIHTYN